MQIFTCPFCGARDETEFRFMGEAGKQRPEGGRAVGEAEWAAYLYLQRNEKGPVREIWMHQPCGELFLLARDNVTHAAEPGVGLRPEGA
ncbi:sarcosine oxidase subunit delta [Alsobacter sp. SYSU M60028]|uniref:Sarcosine oxidase subunit delta n=1 Tax=Alsobacter ponti TaxID=2962936 RepID=A0ABT1L807_9HYPH|nr:sarcosine oxidase subunit delta [Alsobacter ponti]MCP8937635.1 sarcosine oxidase subunit delta [Alsobacter ponti]